MALDYKSSGVDIEAGYKAVELMKKHVRSTARPELIGGIGGFSGAFDMTAFKKLEEPVLLSGTDGVGTKLKLAFLLDKHDTIGGVAEGCRQAGAALVGGETAEMPGFYPEDEYDLAGFAVGIADKKELIDGSSLKSGDVLIGIASSGVHSNGFSLVRKVFDMTAENLKTFRPELGDTLGNVLIAPTKRYVKALKSVKEAGAAVKACSHITGGGFYENVPRMLKEGIRAVINKDSYPVPPIFSLMQRTGEIEEKIMYNTFNMGIGMVIAVDPAHKEKALAALRSAGENAYEIGYLEAGQKGVDLR